MSISPKVQKANFRLFFILWVFLIICVLYKACFIPIWQTKICTEPTTATIVQVETYKRGTGKEKGTKVKDENCQDNDHEHFYLYTYSFTVDEQTYTGYDYRQNKETLQYNVGDTVTIQYDPEDPSIFMLQLNQPDQPELNHTDYLLMGIGVLLMLAPLIVSGIGAFKK